MELLQRRRSKALVSHLKGIAQGAGIELAEDADLEQIVQGASDGVQALTRHMAQTFLTSSNLRGMGEAWGKLTAPILGAPDSDPDQPRQTSPRIVILLQQLHERQNVIDGQVIEPGEGRAVKIVRD
jgi:hypothetical protein